MFKDNKDFYPTPHNLIKKMVEDIDFRRLSSILEPSAGKGDIALYLKTKYEGEYGRYNSEKLDIDCIEKDLNLQKILKDNYRVVHDDFLTYNTYKKYDYIVMNPPFGNGDKHLLKAIKLQERHGGKIVCLLNAETIKNPFSNDRKLLRRKLEQYNSSIEFLKDMFIGAERSTFVEVALIKIDIPKKEYDSSILNELKKEELNINKDNSEGYLITDDFLKEIINQYNFEIKTGLRLINEYNKLMPLMSKDFKNGSPVLELKISNNTSNNLVNGYIENIRAKYWETLFNSKEFTGLFTNNLKQKYQSMITELRNYDFSMYNIATIKIQLNSEMMVGLEETILKLFDEFSHQHSYYNEMSKNILHYNGWKTNKAHKINKKVIIILNGYNWYYKNKLDLDYKVKEKIEDIEKVFSYLDTNNLTEKLDIDKVLKEATEQQQSKKIKTNYFYITFYKKGTCHIEFRDMKLLHKFNIYGSQRKGWLPPDYMNKSYTDMSKEEQQVIYSFEGLKSYLDTLDNKEFYNTNLNNVLMLNQ